MSEVDPVTEAMKLAHAVLAQSITAGHNVPGPTPEDIEKAFWALDAALTVSKPEQAVTEAASQPTIHAMFETVDPSVPVIGTTTAPIKRIEQNDDGSYLVVIDHWPHKGGADRV